MAIGLDAKLYYGAAGSTAATELTIVREVTMESSADDIVSAFRDGTYKSHEAGQLDLTVNVTMKLKSDNAGFQSFVTAFTGRSKIALKVISKTSGVGWDADFAVISMSEPQPIDGVLEVTFACAINTESRTPTRVT